ncbi:hypothetical protein DJ68_09580 [Halorubrum sp. C3]|nr:hypothetical protein DJ68_09580 [Halorubrum sp. C3]
MPSITRRKTIGLLTGCVALSAIGGAVAHTTQKNAPHLIVNNQTERELGLLLIGYIRWRDRPLSISHRITQWTPRAENSVNGRETGAENTQSQGDHE